MRVLPLFLLALTGCGVLDAALEGLVSDEATVALDLCSDDNLGCGDTASCPLDECDLVCGFDGRCDDPDRAYSDCGAANNLVERTEDGDLVLYDLEVIPQDADTVSFSVVVEDDADRIALGDVDVGNGFDFAAPGASPIPTNFFFDEIEPGHGILSFDVEAAGSVETMAFSINDRSDGRRANVVCLFETGAPLGR